MSRRLFPAAVLGIQFVVALPAAPPTPTQVSLTKHPDYHTGTIRFYDPDMHGANWAAARTRYAPLLDHLADTDELQTVMMMIGELNASHTGVSGGPNNLPQTEQTRFRGSISSPTRPVDRDQAGGLRYVRGHRCPSRACWP